MRFIVVFCLVLSSLTANAGSWVYVTKTVDGIRFYVQGTKKRGGTLTTWVLQEYSREQIVGKKSYRSVAMKMLFNCDEENYILRSAVAYKDFSGLGVVVSDEDYEDDSKHSVPPNSAWEDILTFVCK